MNRGMALKVVAILASVVLMTQVIPVEATGSTERKDKATESDRIKAEKTNLKVIIKNAKIAWKTAKVATETAKDTWRADKTTANKDAIATAKAAELVAYNAWKKAVQDFKDYKPRTKASEVTTATAVISEEKKAKLDVKAKRDLWKDAKAAAKAAGKVYKADQTAANYDLWAQAETAVDTAYTNYQCSKQILKDVRNDVAKSCTFT